MFLPSTPVDAPHIWRSCCIALRFLCDPTDTPQRGTRLRALGPCARPVHPRRSLCFAGGDHSGWPTRRAPPPARRRQLLRPLSPRPPHGLRRAVRPQCDDGSAPVAPLRHAPPRGRRANRPPHPRPGQRPWPVCSGARPRPLRCRCRPAPDAPPRDGTHRVRDRGARAAPEPPGAAEAEGPPHLSPLSEHPPAPRLHPAGALCCYRTTVNVRVVTSPSIRSRTM